MIKKNHGHSVKILRGRSGGFFEDTFCAADFLMVFQGSGLQLLLPSQPLSAIAEVMKQKLRGKITFKMKLSFLNAVFL